MIVFVSGVLIFLLTVFLCNDGAESRDHLFFEYPFNEAIWGDMLSVG